MIRRACALVLATCVLPLPAWADGCASDADCKAGRVCVSGACQEPARGCQSDRDCPGDLVCEGGQCVDRGQVPAPPPPAAPPAAGPAPAAPTPPNWVPGRPLRQTGPRLALEAFGGGGFHTRGDAGTGLGWVFGGAAGVRFSGGIGLVALGGFSGATAHNCDQFDFCTDERMRLVHAGAGASLRTRGGSTTLGLAWMEAPDMPRGSSTTGGGLIFRYFYNIADGFSIVVDSALGVVGDWQVATFSLGFGWVD